MRTALLNTGTELLLGGVQEAHLSFIARQIFPLGLRITEQRTVPDGDAINQALADLSSRTDILFVSGGLGPTTDDITREAVATSLGVQLRQNPELLESLRQRLAVRRIPWTDRIGRQADVPEGAEVLPNENGSAPGLYLKAKLNPQISSPHLFVLPGPPRELQPMFETHVMPILRRIADVPAIEQRIYKLAFMGESLVERAIGEKVLAIPGIELGYCARPGEVDVRIVGAPGPLRQADQIIRQELASSIFTTSDETIEEVLIKHLIDRHETIAVAESCTGGLLAHRLTNVAGSSKAFAAGFVTYANEVKTDTLNVDPKLLEQHGAVSEEVARAMAEGARSRAKTDYGLSTTGVAGPTGGSNEKPVGTVYIGLVAPGETVAKKFFFPSDRETFKQLTAQAAFEMLRRKLVAGS